jgi:hypothetical protein
MLHNVAAATRARRRQDLRGLVLPHDVTVMLFRLPADYRNVAFFDARPGPPDRQRSCRPGYDRHGPWPTWPTNGVSTVAANQIIRAD